MQNSTKYILPMHENFIKVIHLRNSPHSQWYQLCSSVILPLFQIITRYSVKMNFLIPNSWLTRMAPSKKAIFTQSLVALFQASFFHQLKNIRNVHF